MSEPRAGHDDSISGAHQPATSRLHIADMATTAGHLMVSLRSRRGRLFVLIMLLAVSGALALVTPRVLGHIVDLVDRGGDVGDVLGLSGWMVAAAAGAAITGGIALAVAAGIFESVLAELRESMIARALHLPVARVEAAGSGDLVSRATADVDMVGEAIGRALPSVLTALVTVVVTVIGLGTLDWRFLAVVLVTLPVYVVAARMYLSRAPVIYATERSATADRAHHVLGAIQGVDTVRAFELSAPLQHRVERHSWRVVGWTMRATVLRHKLDARLNFGEFLGMATILVVGFFLVDAGTVTVGATTAAMLFYLALFGPLGALMYVLDDLQSGAAALSRIVGVLDEGRSSGTAGEIERSSEPHLIAAGVDFAYIEGHPVLTAVDLTVRPGEHVALVGRSGAGKSTLGAILAGLYRPTVGSVRLDGVELTDLDDAHRARRVALLTQEVHVFSGPLREDLSLARPDSDDATLWAALDKVGATTWVRHLPDSIDTVVGDHGHQLSAMQAQQLALARIDLLDPAVVIVDEATADAGSAGAGELEAAADAVLAGRSALIIAHRLSQAAAADRIVFLERGRVVESGPHDELVAAEGRYAEIWRAWSRGRGGESV